MKSDNIRLVYMPHLFKSDREVRIVKRDTYENIFNSLENPLDISYAVNINKDTKV